MTESVYTPILDRLREETAAMHKTAESQPLEQHLIKGTLPREEYIAYLAQRYLIHRELEGRLSALRPLNAAIGALLKDHQIHHPRLSADLRFFGMEPELLEPLEATRRMIAMIQAQEAKAPENLLGIQYVFEGSTNGARFIARSVRAAYGLEGQEGTRYLDPYGEEQRALWARFKEEMNAWPFTGEQRDGIVNAGVETFLHLIEVDRALYNSAL